MSTKWGIISAGKICHDFVTAVQSIPGQDHEVVSIAARSLEAAKNFAVHHNIPQAYGSYEELAKDPNVEVVYIGNLAPQHLSVGKLMLENGKHLLVEKPMTLNLKQTKELIATAQKHKRFLMEAIWSRFLPSYRYVMEVINNGTIGEVVHADVNFSVYLMEVERLVKRALGGGTILDLGIYTINAVSMVFGSDKPLKIASVGHLNDDGVDIAMSTSLLYSKNRTATISTNAQAEGTCEFVVTGTKGKIKILHPFWCATIVHVDEEKQEFPLPDTIRPCNYVNSSGLRYEAMEVRECIKRGALESSILPLKDTKIMTEISDEIRRQIGVQFDEDLQ